MIYWSGKGESSVRCPFCNQDNTRVVDSRPVEDTNSIRRRRLCDACGKRFTTYEKVETIPADCDQEGSEPGKL